MVKCLIMLMIYYHAAQCDIVSQCVMMLKAASIFPHSSVFANDAGPRGSACKERLASYADSVMDFSVG